MTKNTSLYSALLTTLFLGACSDGTVQSGGGAGDTNGEAAALIAPFVGVYELPDNWRGRPVSEAYLEIQDPNDDGVSTSLTLEVNTMNNCIEPRPSQGEVKKDPVQDRIFLDSFFFGRAVLSREGNDLVINLFEDVSDIDNDRDFDEAMVLRAEQAFIDLPPTCQ
ncbi:MAG: hypothetical protein AB8B64_14430 [Granulosicoccus sp.]